MSIDSEKDSEKKMDDENKINLEAAIIPPEDKFAIFEARLKKLEDRGRKRGKRYSRIGLIYSVIICIVVLISGYIIIKQINDFSNEAAESAGKIAEMNNSQTSGKLIFHTAWKNCQDDSDCTETQKDCCSCDSGGEQISINNLFFTEWSNLLRKNCKNSVCSVLKKCQAGISVCKEKKCFFEVAKIGTSSENTLISSTTSSIILDTDGDGLTDEEEINYGTDVNNSDTDSDGFLDKDEIDKGYNPRGDGLFVNN